MPNYLLKFSSDGNAGVSAPSFSNDLDDEEGDEEDEETEEEDDEE